MVRRRRAFILRVVGVRCGCMVPGHGSTGRQEQFAGLVESVPKANATWQPTSNSPIGKHDPRRRVRSPLSVAPKEGRGNQSAGNWMGDSEHWSSSRQFGREPTVTRFISFFHHTTSRIPAHTTNRQARRQAHSPAHSFRSGSGQDERRSLLASWQGTWLQAGGTNDAAAGVPIILDLISTSSANSSLHAF